MRRDPKREEVNGQMRQVNSPITYEVTEASMKPPPWSNAVLLDTLAPSWSIANDLSSPLSAVFAVIEGMGQKRHHLSTLDKRS